MNLKQKLKTFFHDPVDKAFNIQQHKNKAVEYASVFNIETIFENDVEESDHIASAADRLNFFKQNSEENLIIDWKEKAELTHPLGCGRIQLAGEKYGYIVVDYSEIEGIIKQSLSEIKKQITDEKKLLLTLWRNIPDKFKNLEYEKFRLGNLWNLLPADTRLPDHSILDHNWLAVAINGSLPNPAFLKFSIGPVQSFILAAKRTEDYWAGSYILSYLSSKAIEVIIDKVGPEHIIYPYIKYQPLIDKILKEKYSITIDESLKRGTIKIPSLSNIIFAILPAGQAKVIAEEMKKNVEDSFKNIATEIKENFKEILNDNTLTQLWDNQISNFVEVYYTIYKWQDNTEELKQQYKKITNTDPEITEGMYENNLGNYWQAMYKIVDTAFNSRKNLRNFSQINSTSNFVKCSLCGERDALHNKNITRPSQLTEFWANIGKNEKSKYKIDPQGRDKLCAVCFTKRMFGEYFFSKNITNESISFPSTATIAALPFKLEIVKNWQKTFNIVKNYNELLNKLKIPKNFDWNLIKYIPKNVMYGKNMFNPQSEEFKVFSEFLSFDGQWIYEESWTEKNLKEHNISYDQEIVEYVLSAISRLKELLGDKPSKYYAVLAMDGDNMGQWLSGTHPNWPVWKDVLHSKVADVITEELKNEKRNLSPSVHAFISKCLNFFSLELVGKVVEMDFPGKLVYCGGDDVLAFIPVEYALSIAEKVRFTFSGNLNEDCNIDLNHKNGYIVLKEGNNKKIVPTLGKATMSAGIVIAHKDHDLADVLRNVRSAEKEAKEKYERDAFVIKILKHSGSIVEFGSKWLVNNSRAVENINFIISKVAKDKNKEGLSMSFFQSTFDELEKLGYEVTDIVSSLLKRQLNRHTHLKKRDNETDEEYKKRKDEFINEIKTRINNSVSGLSTLKDLLLVLRFLVDGGKR